MEVFSSDYVDIFINFSYKQPITFALLYGFEAVFLICALRNVIAFSMLKSFSPNMVTSFNL